LLGLLNVKMHKKTFTL